MKFRLLDTSALPGPHDLFKCTFRNRYDALVGERQRETRAVTLARHEAVRIWTQQGLEPLAACPYHDVDWRLAAEIACATLAEATDNHQDLADVVIARNDLPPAVRCAAASFFYDPIVLNSRGDEIVNGQHRICAVLAAGAARCVIDDDPE